MRIKHRINSIYIYFDVRWLATIEHVNLCSFQLSFWHCKLQYLDNHYLSVTSGCPILQLAQTSGISKLNSQASTSSLLSKLEPEEASEDSSFKSS